MGRSAAALAAYLTGALPSAEAAPPPGDSAARGIRPTPVEFRWDAPDEGCPDETQVRAELERIVGRPLDDLQASRLTVIARVRREPDGTWDLRLWTVTPEQTRYRTINDESCALVSNAAALIAAMIVDPRQTQEEDARAVDPEVREKADEAEAVAVEVAPDDPPAPAPTPSTPPEDSTPQPSPPRRDLQVGLGVFGGPAFDGRPGIRPSLSVAAAVGKAHGLAEVELHYGPALSTPLSGAGPAASFHVSDLHVALHGCYDHRAHRRVNFSACGGFELGALLGRGEGLEDDRIDAVPWVALDLRPLLGVRLLSSLWLELAPELTVPLAQTRFEVAGLGVVHEPRAVGGRVLLGFRWWWGKKPPEPVTDPDRPGHTGVE